MLFPIPISLGRIENMQFLIGIELNNNVTHNLFFI